MKICAFDVETANNQATSVCSIGIYLIEEGTIIDSFYSLVKPIPNEFLFHNVQIHHIKKQDVADAKTFAELWPDISWYFEESVLVAHAAGFDVGCMCALLKDAGLPMPSAMVADSVKMSRLIWPDLENHKLNTCAHAMNLDFNHHNAQDDAWVSAMIAIEFMHTLQCLDMAEAYQKCNWILGTVDASGYHSNLPVRQAKPEQPFTKPEQVDDQNYFYQKKICFTTKLTVSRHEMKQCMINQGAFIMDDVVDVLDILVVNDETLQSLATSRKLTSKLRRALSFRKQGYPLEIMSEAQLREHLSENTVDERLTADIVLQVSHK